jgi:hypothetical protein
MKKLLLGALAAAAIATPAAYADTSGSIDTGYTTADFDGSEYDALHLGGAVQIDAWDGWAVQLDGRTSLMQWDDDCCDDSQAYAALHADTNTGAWDFGGWVGILNYYGSGGATIGAETRTNFGNLSLQGSLGYGTFQSFFDYSGLQGNIGASYFFNPNLAVNFAVAQTNFDSDGASDTDMTDLSIGGQYGFGNGFEVYGGYMTSELDYGSGDYDVDTINIGLRYHFGAGTLQDVANDGASWHGAQLLSDAFPRWD